MTRRRLRNTRPKAFWGAVVGGLIGAGASLFGSKSSADSQLRAQERERLRQEATDMYSNANTNYQNRVSQVNQLVNSTANSLYSANQRQAGFASQFRTIAKNGAKRRKSIKDRVRITDGGIALPLGDNTFLLRGSSHSQINESGKTGIGIKVGNNEIEAQDGEPIQVKNGEVRIFSNSLELPNGETPAEALLSGENPDIVIEEQEILKDMINGRKSVRSLKRNGGRPKADWGAVLPGIIQSLGSVGGALITSNAYDKMKAPNAPLAPKYITPILQTAQHLDTRINVDPEAQRTTNLINTALRKSDNNTLSSAAALSNRRSMISVYADEMNKLYGDKYTKEIALRNQDIQNWQAVSAQNADTTNKVLALNSEISNNYNKALQDYVDSVSQFDNQVTMGKANAWSSAIDTIGKAAADYGSYLHQQRLSDKAMLAQIGSSTSPNAIKRIGNSLSTDMIKDFYNEAIAKKDNENAKYWGTILNTRRKLGGLGRYYNVNINPIF